MIFILFMLFLLILSAFFSGSETALFSLTPERARRLREHRQIGLLIDLLQRESSGLLTAILFGNLVVNVLFFCTGAAASVRWSSAHGEWMEAVGGILILIALIVIGEIIPKALGVTHPVAVLQVTSLPLRFWFHLTRPFRRGTDLLLKWMRLDESKPLPGADLTLGEFRELLQAIRHEPGFGSREKAVLEDIVDLTDVRVREIMVPRVEVFRAPVKMAKAMLLETAREKRFSRVPVYGERDDDILGYVHVKDLFLSRQKTASLRPFLHPLVFVPETKRADILLRELLEHDWKMVAVVDEYGGLAGIVTIEDLLSEVIGELEDAEQESLQQVDELTYRLDGQLPIREWRELFIGVLPEQQIKTMAFDTLGGLIVSLLGRMPVAGDRVTVRNLQLTVESMHRRRIGTVLLHLQSAEVLS